MATLIMTAKLNDVDPQAWLADVLARIADTPQSRLHELLPSYRGIGVPQPALSRQHDCGPRRRVTSQLHELTNSRQFL
jgi:hypothetical protein